MRSGRAKMIMLFSRSSIGCRSVIARSGEWWISEGINGEANALTEAERTGQRKPTSDVGEKKKLYRQDNATRRIERVTGGAAFSNPPNWRMQGENDGRDAKHRHERRESAGAAVIRLHRKYQKKQAAYHAGQLNAE